MSVVADYIETSQFWLLAEVLGEIRHRKIFTRAYHNTAVTLVEPLGLGPFLTRWRTSASDAPLEHLHGIGEVTFVLLSFEMLMHLVSGRGAVQMCQASASD